MSKLQEQKNLFSTYVDESFMNKKLFLFILFCSHKKDEIIHDFLLSVFTTWTLKKKKLLRFSFNIIRIYISLECKEKWTKKCRSFMANKRKIIQVESRWVKEGKTFSIIFTWMKFYLRFLWTKVIAGILSLRVMIKFLNSLDLCG